MRACGLFDLDRLTSKITKMLFQGCLAAKAGFGAVSKATEYVKLASKPEKQACLQPCTPVASIPGSFPITGEDLIKINPRVLSY